MDRGDTTILTFDVYAILRQILKKGSSATAELKYQNH